MNRHQFFNNDVRLSGVTMMTKKLCGKNGIKVSKNNNYRRKVGFERK